MPIICHILPEDMSQHSITQEKYQQIVEFLTTKKAPNEVSASARYKFKKLASSFDLEHARLDFTTAYHLTTLGMEERRLWTSRAHEGLISLSDISAQQAGADI